MKNLCLFDLDGTLTDPKMGITKSVDHALNTFGIQTENLDDLQKFIGPPLWDSFRDYYHFTDAQAQEAVCQYREYFVVRGIFENTLYDGILVMLNLLSEKGIHMAIATSKPTVYTERIAEYFGLSRYFKAIVGSELDGTRSKKGEVIAYALQLLNADRKKETVIIGDHEHDIIGAQEIGLDSIGVTWEYGTRSELEEAGATRIPESPEDLYRLILGEM